MDEWMDTQTDRIWTDKLIIVLLSLRSSTAITGTCIISLIHCITCSVSTQEIDSKDVKTL